MARPHCGQVVRSMAKTRLSHWAQLRRARVEGARASPSSLAVFGAGSGLAGHDLGPQRRVGCQHAMETNEMEPRTWDEGGQALQEFQRGHHQMGGAIAVRRFELEDDLAGWCTAQAFVAQDQDTDTGQVLIRVKSLVDSYFSRIICSEKGVTTALDTTIPKSDASRSRTRWASTAA